MDRETILQILDDRLSVAKQRNQKAAALFSEIVADYPTSVPYPDSVTRMQKAASSYRTAMRQLSVAQEDLTEFLLTGTLPNDLGRLP